MILIRCEYVPYPIRFFEKIDQIFDDGRRMIFTRYMLRNLLFVTVFMAVTLAGIVMLTQSIRFLELIVDSGASSWAFWLVTLLALPRFFEIILPLALTISVIFLYNRMSSDSELVVARSAGLSPMQLARPALYLAGIVTLVMFLITSWLAPASVTMMQQMRITIKAQYSSMLLREGVFNSVGKNLTVYIHERASNGEINGLMIHDTRDKNNPVTILARRGVILSSDAGQQVLVYEGSRQDINPRTGALNNLQFQRYTIDLPDSDPVRNRARKADEMTIFELADQQVMQTLTPAQRDNVTLEIWRRIGMPFLSCSFTLVALMFMVIGPVDRRGQAKRIMMALGTTIFLQAAYIGLSSMAQTSLMGLVLMYALIFIPALLGLFVLSRYGEGLRHRVLYGARPVGELS